MVMSNPEGSLEVVEFSPQLLAENLRTATTFAKHPDLGFKGIFLSGPSGLTDWLEGECDPSNRAMLDRLYDLSHADVGAAVITESLQDSDYSRQTRIPAGHGFAFLELEDGQLQPDGQSKLGIFRVLVIANGVTLDS